MSKFKHHAIIVTCWDNDAAVETRDKAMCLFHPEMVTPIIESPYGGFKSFMVVPDGGKETRNMSSIYDEARELYVKCLHAYNVDCAKSDDKIPVDFIEVSFGGDDARSNIENYNNEDY